MTDWEKALAILDQPAATPSGRRAWRLQGVKGGARAFFVFTALRRHPRPSLVITAGAKEAERFAADLRFFFGESDTASPFVRRIHYLPAWDVVPFEDLSPPADATAARIEGLYHLRQGIAPIIVTTAESLLQRVAPVADLAPRHLYLVERDTVDRDALAARLGDWGYRAVPLVEDRGDFALRGGVIDVFPPAHARPIRLQLEFDTIEAMHEFDPVSQRLLDRQSELLILPVREFSVLAGQQREVQRAVEARALELDIHRDERHLIIDGLASGVLFPGVELCLPYFYARLDSVFDYVPADSWVWIDNPPEVEAGIERLWDRIQERAAERAAEHRFFPPAETLFLSPQAWRAALADRPTVELEPLEVLGRGTDATPITVRSFATTDLKIQRAHPRGEISFDPVAERIRDWCAHRQRVFFVAGNDAQASRIARLLENHDVHAEVPTTPFHTLVDAPASHPRIVVGDLHDGFRLPDDGLAIVTDADVFGESRRRATRRVSVTQLLKNLSELKPDDYIVHLDHGVGIYRGLKHMHVAGTDGDFLHLEYAGGDRLYVPVDRISLVQKYVGADGTVPAIDKLGGATWERVKAKTRESILAMAHELLAIYAAREVHELRRTITPDPYYREFEAAFPFEETPDQQQAIDEIVADLQRSKPMDRLICGDVGYGKTEVALRAAFLTVMDGRQVAILVPTTVLAQQHLATCRRRFEGYPMRIEALSRFLSPARTREVLAGVREGTVDIVIGTHRLLQRDVEFKRLGLLVIDEEHRFGVRHKERIKEMRKIVDALTLTATPIPRTLQMSLLGIRDLSVIETPPVDRLAVRTYLSRYDDDLIRDAIERERQRGGQVFFVHNKVENIDIMARHLRTIVPAARIAVAHGQMPEGELEKVMLAFINRETDVLVCSAIIESGLDIPNANTIIINRADQFGLAQLYQLRGRVGRSHERAYAYLIIPGEHLITRDAQKRLRVLQELDDLGGGFRLAAHDLEIRGAGNLLGKQQSGHITAVGFELYTQMMEDAVRELRGELAHIEVEPEIALGVPAYIPGTYIPDETQRLGFYRRLAAIRKSTELTEIATELGERYGPIPPIVDNLLRVMDLRRTLKERMVVRATMRQGMVTFQFHPDAPVDVDDLVALVQRGKKRFRLSADFQLTVIPTNTDWDGLLTELQSVLQEIPFRSRPNAEAHSDAVPA